MHLHRRLKHNQEAIQNIVFLIVAMSTILIGTATKTGIVKPEGNQDEGRLNAAVMETDDSVSPSNHSRRSIPFVDFKEGSSNTVKDVAKTSQDPHSKGIPLIDFGQTSSGTSSGIQTRRMGGGSQKKPSGVTNLSGAINLHTHFENGERRENDETPGPGQEPAPGTTSFNTPTEPKKTINNRIGSGGNTNWSPYFDFGNPSKAGKGGTGGRKKVVNNRILSKASEDESWPPDAGSGSHGSGRETGPRRAQYNAEESIIILNLYLRLASDDKEVQEFHPAPVTFSSHDN